MTTNVLNTKTENKIPDFSGLVKMADYIAKISDIDKKYFTTSDYNKFTSKVVDEKVRQANLATNIDFSTVLQLDIRNGMEKNRKTKNV